MDVRSAAAAPNNIKIKLLLFVTTHYKKGAKTKNTAFAKYHPKL